MFQIRSLIYNLFNLLLTSLLKFIFNYIYKYLKLFSTTTKKTLKFSYIINDSRAIFNFLLMFLPKV